MLSVIVTCSDSLFYGHLSGHLNYASVVDCSGSCQAEICRPDRSTTIRSRHGDGIRRRHIGRTAEQAP